MTADLICMLPKYETVLRQICRELFFVTISYILLLYKALTNLAENGIIIKNTHYKFKENLK